MEIVRYAVAIALVAVGLAETASAQSATADNGTDPTKLRRMVWGYYEHMDLRDGMSRDTVKLMYETPILRKPRCVLRFPSHAIKRPGSTVHSASGIFRCGRHIC